MKTKSKSKPSAPKPDNQLTLDDLVSKVEHVLKHQSERIDLLSEVAKP